MARASLFPSGIRRAGLAAVLSLGASITCGASIQRAVPPPEAGVLRGWVLDGVGRGVEGLELEAFELGLGSDAGPAAKGRTQQGGWFELRGLRDAPHRLDALTRHAGWRERRRPLAERLPSDGRARELTFERPHLVVSLIDAAGETWSGDAKAVSHANGGFSTRPEVVVAPAVDELLAETRADFLPGGFVSGRPLGGGAFDFQLEEGRTYLVGLRRRGQAWRPVELFVPWGSTEGYEELLVVRDDAPEGTVVLTAFDADGRALEDVEARVEDPTTGTLLARWGQRPPFRRAGPLEMALPSGSWRVIVDGTARRDFHHGRLQASRSSGHFERRIDVAPGVETMLEARLDRGATLRVEAVGLADDGDRAAVWPAYRRDSPTQCAWWASRADLSLHRPGRWPIRMDVATLVEEGTSGDGVRLLSSVALGSRSTSELLPTGRFTLRASLPGGRVVTAPVVLVEGETTDVRLEFR